MEKEENANIWQNGSKNGRQPENEAQITDTWYTGRICTAC